MQRADRWLLTVSVLGWLLLSAGLLIPTFRDEIQNETNIFLILFACGMLAAISAVLTVVLITIPLRIAMNLAIKRHRRTRLMETITLLFCFILAIAYPFEVVRERRKLAPPKDVTTLVAFADQMPPPRGLALIRHDGNEYIAWRGELSGPVDLPSGAACYLFDTNGNLFKWQPETGDGGPVDDILKSSEALRTLTLQEAVAMTTPKPKD